MFSFIKKALQGIAAQFARFQSLFTKEKIDAETLKELEKILLTADTGVATTRIITKKLEEEVARGKLATGTDLKAALEAELIELLQVHPYKADAAIYLLVGINGSGKTTLAAKLASWLTKQHKKVLLVAGDTFRAAATEQLQEWGKKLGLRVVQGEENQDPASVVYKGCEEFKTGGYDAIIIDTAGRLQTKTNLMKELEKIHKIVQKQLGDKKISTLLTVDSMLGQNSFDQARLFHESTKLDGIVLTKMDSTGKGGIVFAITHELKIPIAFISYGEQPDQLALFDPSIFVRDLLS